MVASLWVASLVGGCSLGPVDLEGKLCPCGPGWHCDVGRNVCVPGAERMDGSTGDDGAVPIEGGVADGPVDGGGERDADPVRAYRRTLTVPAEMVSGSLDGFPLLVSLTEDPGLAAHALADASDARFFAEDGSPLAAEIERYDAARGDLVAWVRVPSLSADADTILYLEYGDADAEPGPLPSAVWAGDFAAVWHFGQAPTGEAEDIRDSTGRGHHGTSGGAAGVAGPAHADGLIGRGLDLDAASRHRVTVPDSDDWDLTSRSVTISLWFRADVSQPGGDYPRLVERFEGGVPGDGWFLSLEPPSNTLGFNHRDDDTGNDASVEYATAVNDETWHMAAVTLDGSVARMYVDGLESEMDGYANLFDRRDDLRFGVADVEGDHAFAGSMDEIRVLHVARSPEWIATEHRNQSDPGSFLTVGPEVGVP